MRPLATFVIFLFSGNLKITQTSGETRSKRGGKVLLSQSFYEETTFFQEIFILVIF